MADDQMKRLKKRVPVIANRMAGKTKGLVREMKKLRIIREDEFLDDVNPPDKALEKLADSGNKHILEYLKTEMIKEGLQNIVLEIVTGKRTQKRSPNVLESVSGTASSSANLASDDFPDHLDDKLKTHDPTKAKDKLQMESDGRRLEEIVQANEEMKETMGVMKNTMNQGFAHMGETLRQIQEEVGKRVETQSEMIMKLQKEIEELKLSLENKTTSFNTLQQQFDHLEKNYNALRKDMKNKGKKGSALIEENKRLQKEIEALRKRLLDTRPLNQDKKKLYGELVSPRKK